VTPERFRKELLRDHGQSVGQLDARYVGQDADAAGEVAESDPSSTAIENAYLSGFNDYLTRTLGVDLGRRYKGYAAEVWASWKWVDPHNVAAHINLAPIIGKAMRANRDFRVFLGSGSYDLSTPIFASELAVAHNGIRASQVTMKEYGSGHMVYTDERARTALLADLRTFLGSGDVHGGH
jgi:carboxypeptidase C (cathepsin A)